MYRSFESSFFSRHLHYIESSDVDRLMRQYHEQAVLICFDQMVAGHENIRHFLIHNADCLVQLELESIEKYTERENIIFLQAIALSDAGKKNISYILILLDGKLLYQIVIPDKRMSLGVQPTQGAT